MIELKNNQLEVSFPEVHPLARCTIDFQRTLRIPDDNQSYPLPAGLGSFPLFPVDDYDVLQSWKSHGGVFLPMYQSEAMWIHFSNGLGYSFSGYPFAVKVAAGKINAVTGDPWKNELSREKQDYAVLPRQKWIDGFSVTADVVRQFVAMPLGSGVTAEEQLTGEANWGGLQLIFYPMKAAEYRRRFEVDSGIRFSRRQVDDSLVSFDLCESAAMGLAPGGKIDQVIEKDDYGIDAWDTSVSSRCFVHLLNAERFSGVTGLAPLTQPITQAQYANAGIPWFEYYGAGTGIGGSDQLRKLDGLSTALFKKDGTHLKDNAPITIAQTVQIRASPAAVRDTAGW